MPASVALTICILFICVLFYGDRNRESGTSGVLWIPMLWVVIAGSIPVAHWLGFETMVQGQAGVESGNPVDSVIYLSLLAAAFLMVLTSHREVRIGKILGGNLWVIILLFYCGISVLWSDLSFVSFKRWIKEVGTLMMVLIVMTEDSYPESLRWILRRCAYIMIPMSVLLIKYFPHLGRSFDPWTGMSYTTGVATSKNMLGIMCTVFALFFIWEVMTKWRGKNSIIDLFLLAIIAWLLVLADSATSIITLLIASVVLVGLRMIKGHAQYVTEYFASSVIILTILVLLAEFELFGSFVEGLGRDMTLTGRTRLWGEIIKMVPSTILGAGYDSFWLGDRLTVLWSIFWWHPIQAHNGYLEIYLNLGLIGIFLYAGVIVTAYRHISKGLIKDFDYGALRMIFFIIALIYNVTEAVFKGLNIIWFLFLIAALDNPNVFYQVDDDT